MDSNIQLKQGTYYIVHRDGKVIIKGVADGKATINTPYVLDSFDNESDYISKLNTLIEEDEEWQ